MLVAAFVLGLPFLLVWGYGLLILLVLVAAVLAVASAWVSRRLFPNAAGRPFASVWSRSLSGWTLILGVVVAAPFYYLMVVTDTRPATVPQVSLTNGSKRVVFQDMQHIGSERFYQAVIYDVEKALSEGYVSGAGVATLRIGYDADPANRLQFSDVSVDSGLGQQLSAADSGGTLVEGP